MATPVTLKLTTVDLPTLCEALLTVASKWYIIGLQMNIPSSTLDIIKVDLMYEGVQACFIEMLKIWLKSLQHPTPSWPNLVAVLRTKSVGESQLAAQLEKEYCLHLQVSEDHTLVQLPQSDSSNDEWNLIEVLCQEFKIDLNEKCNTEVFLQMKAFFDWQVISPHLNIDVLDIAKESSTEEEKCWKALQRWRETSGDGATYHTLTKAMLKAGRIDQVFRVLKEIFKIIDKNDSEIEGKMVLLQQYFEGSVGSTPSFHTADDIENEQWENLCQLPKLEEAVPQAVMNTENLTASPHIEMTLQDTKVDVEEHRSPSIEMKALTSTYPGVYEQVEQDFQAMDNLSESFLLASTPEDSDQNAERDNILSNTVNGYSPTSDHDQINDRNDNDSRIMENMEPLVERTAANGTTEFDLDDLTDTSPLLSDHGTEHEHRMFEDDSTIRSVGLCRKMLTRYCLCHEKICQSIETRKLKCKCFVGVVGSASLITSVVFMMVLLISGSNYLVRGSLFAVPNYPVIAGFDPYYVSKVELHTDIESDLHKVSYYVRTVPKCSLLSTRNFSVNSSAERHVSEAISNFDSNYLLPGSEITYNLNLDSVSSTNCSAMVYIFDDVNAHLRLIYQSDVLGAIDSICLSNGSANFTVIASKPSHYVVDIQFNEPYPTSVFFTASGVIFYYDITYLSPSNIVPGVTPFEIITWTGGIVMKKETRSTCVIVVVHKMPGDKPDTFLKINYTAKRTFLQNAQDLAFLILCVLSAMPFIIIVLFGIYLYMYVLLVRCFGKCI